MLRGSFCPCRRLIDAIKDEVAFTLSSRGLQKGYETLACLHGLWQELLALIALVLQQGA